MVLLLLPNCVVTLSSYVRPPNRQDDERQFRGSFVTQRSSATLVSFPELLFRVIPTDGSVPTTFSLPPVRGEGASCRGRSIHVHGVEASHAADVHGTSFLADDAHCGCLDGFRRSAPTLKFTTMEFFADSGGVFL